MYDPPRVSCGLFKTGRFLPCEYGAITMARVEVGMSDKVGPDAVGNAPCAEEARYVGGHLDAGADLRLAVNVSFLRLVLETWKQPGMYWELAYGSTITLTSAISSACSSIVTLVPARAHAMPVASPPMPAPHIPTSRVFCLRCWH